MLFAMDEMYLITCLLMATIHIADISNKLYSLINIVCVWGGGGVFTNVIKPALLTVFDRPLHTYEEE